MGWLSRIIPALSGEKKQTIPDGVWHQCKGCHTPIYFSDMENNAHVCPKCGHHGTISARKRIHSFLDKDAEIIFIGESIITKDRLKFTDLKPYAKRIKDAVNKTNETAALVAASGCIEKLPVVVAAFEFNYIGGSMDTAVGERFRIAVEMAIEKKCPFICFSASGGARMQEGVLSLLQMAKTSAVLKRLSMAKLPYISVLTNPTTGGVAASLATLGDIIIAEPKALIGFTGPRVIEQTVKQKLPKGFQRSEFLIEHGHIDMVIHRHHMKAKVAGLLKKITAYEFNH